MNNLRFNPILNLKSNVDYSTIISGFQSDTSEHELKIELGRGEYF